MESPVELADCTLRESVTHRFNLGWGGFNVGRGWELGGGELQLQCAAPLNSDQCREHKASTCRLHDIAAAYATDHIPSERFRL